MKLAFAAVLAAMLTASSACAARTAYSMDGKQTYTCVPTTRPVVFPTEPLVVNDAKAPKAEAVAAK